MRRTLIATALALTVGCVPGGENNDDDDGGRPVGDGAVGAFDGGVPDMYTPPCREGAPALDVLFVVDNSGSMCEEQRALTDAFEVFDARMTALGVDYRLAVVSTDLSEYNETPGHFLADPALPAPLLNCTDPTGTAVVPDTEGCEERVMAGEITPVMHASALADPAARADHFRCLATLGTMGDGFEKGLEAMRLALSCEGPNAAYFGDCCVPVVEQGREVLRYDPTCAAEPDFLRPAATLAVVIVGDEDDCSDPAVNPAASRRAICKYGTVDANEDGVPDGYDDAALCPSGDAAACFAEECGERTPRDCEAQLCEIERTENNACGWYRDRLTPVGDYVRFLRGLKRGEQQLVVGTFTGAPLFTESGDRVTFNRGRTPDGCYDEEEDANRVDDMCCPGGACLGSMRYSCEGPLGTAFDGRRYQELADAFGEAPCADPADPACLSLCTPDVMPPLFERLAADIEASFPPACAAE